MSAIASADCGGHSCTLLACLDEVTLTVRDARAGGDGVYVFDLEADSYRFTQRCTVAGSTSCTVSGNAPPDQVAVTTVLNSGNWVIAVAGTPAQVKLTASKDGVALGSASVMPEYSTKF